MFNIKIKSLRNKHQLSQEGLAEILAVSRQAIAKWEAGETHPDLGNLIALSDYFNVSIDSLIKEEKPCLEVDDQCAFDELQTFIYQAKSHTYAAGIEPTTQTKTMKSYTYANGAMSYTDTFVGGNTFFGTETVYLNGNPRWCLNYGGTVTGAPFSSTFHKEALLMLPAQRPLRGPVYYQKGNYTYLCTHQGNLDWFTGVETIYYNETLIYSLNFHGGVTS
ncbi:helix-turn-helix transcriptional regulator [Erysipelothrix sp. HDW6C]|uniref:DUF5680 domain-containing protein n=1 Tax=Erysipelothrix sp. HDW6C TaxID=2714930 RepID=UPI00140D0D85|nr:DUF5680 domain-containing protein [Erysipelothrix sp. HDW6C]QIK70364.1 helix-turn-helix transcriptional regulator [Erysipelothrix sp. HDW6C]